MVITIFFIIVISLMVFSIHLIDKKPKENIAQQPNTLRTKKVFPRDIKTKRLFDNIAVDKFMGFVIKETSSNQIKDKLSSYGISFNEYPSNSQKDEKSILFSYKTCDVKWSVCLTIKGNILQFVSLYYYDPDCFNVYKSLCQELKDRYGMIFDVKLYRDNNEGTETLCFADKSNPCHFTEIVYDSSPIIHQKNIYINYFP